MADIFATTPKVETVRRKITTPPAPHRVTIYAQDGKALSVYPIDAREIVAGGEYSYEPPVMVESGFHEPEPTQVASDTSESEVIRRRGRPPKQTDTVI